MNICRRSCCWWCSKALLFRVTLLLGLIWFLWVGVLENEAATLINAQVDGEMIGKTSTSTTSSVPDHDPHKSLEINFVSKRRVPNGPDPIHNRAGNSHRPPGRA